MSEHPATEPTAAEPLGDPTAERLMTATLRLIGDHGYHGATTRAIAAEAGVSEVTLFRRFGSKADLAHATLAHVTETFRSVGSDPTDDVMADLIRLADAYHGFVAHWPALVARLLAEVTAESDIGLAVSRLIAENARSASTIIEHHQRAGRLLPGSTVEVVSAFLGPILLQATVGRHLPATSSAPPWQAAHHTRRFLAGYGRVGDQPV